MCTLGPKDWIAIAVLYKFSHPHEVTRSSTIVELGLLCHEL